VNSTYPLSLSKEQGSWRAIALAVLVHVLLLAFLWFGISWKTGKPESVNAELWSPPVDETAPVQASLDQSMPAVVQMQINVSETKIENLDITIGQKKKIAQQVLKEGAEVAPVQILTVEPIQTVMRPQIDTKKILKENVGIPAEQEKKDVVRQVANRDVQIQQADDSNGAPDQEVLLHEIAHTVMAMGKDITEKLPGNPDNVDWMVRVNAKILSNVTYATSSADRENNRPVIFAVKLLPDGSIAGIQISKTSGIAEFDEAVRSAIEKSQPYPIDDSGAVPSGFESVIHTIDVISVH